MSNVISLKDKRAERLSESVENTQDFDFTQAIKRNELCKTKLARERRNNNAYLIRILNLKQKPPK